MSGLPAYEIRRWSERGYDTEYAIYELRSKASPHLREPRRLGGLAGAKLALVESGVLRRLRRVGVRLERTSRAAFGRAELPEEDALRLALLFRVVAPMRSRWRIDAVARGIEAMGREEAAYWLGMALHRKNPRRVLCALRVLAAEADLH